jgi:hypothetical protein
MRLAATTSRYCASLKLSVAKASEWVEVVEVAVAVMLEEQEIAEVVAAVMATVDLTVVLTQEETEVEPGETLTGTIEMAATRAKEIPGGPAVTVDLIRMVIEMDTKVGMIAEALVQHSINVPKLHKAIVDGSLVCKISSRTGSGFVSL